MGKGTYAMGGRRKRTCAYGGEGVTFSIFGAYVIILKSRVSCFLSNISSHN